MTMLKYEINCVNIYHFRKIVASPLLLLTAGKENNETLLVKILIYL